MHTIAERQNSTAVPPDDRAVRPRAGGMFRGLAAAAMAAFYAALIFARLWRPDFESESLWRSAISLLAFHIDTFAFQGGMALLVLAAALAIARRWRLVLAAVPAVAFTVGPAAASFLPRKPAPITGKPFKVMTVNLLASNGHTEGIVSEIVGADPDLLLIQEYTRSWEEAIRAAVKHRYPHVFAFPRRDCFGLALFSKFPIERAVNADLRLGGSNLPAMRAELRIEDQSVAVYNLHLMPPASLGQFMLQGRQVGDLLKRVAAEAGPVIVAGDFNLTAESRFGRALAAAGLRDAHALGGRGRGSTWPVNGVLRYVTGVRIDHIYLAGGLTCTSASTGVGAGSDHRPTVAVVGFEPW